MHFTVHFTVTVADALQDEEFVFVTGNTFEIGDWVPTQAFRLVKTDDGHWTGTVSTNADNIKFRYFIGYYLEANVGKPASLIISQWETHLTPRCVMPAVESTNRVCRINVKDVFGFNGGREMVSDGWLVNAEQNQILLTVEGQALKFYKEKRNRELYRIKVLPMDLRHREDSQGHDLDEMEDSMDEPQPTLPSFSRAQIAPLTHSNPKYRDQSADGEEFRNGQDYFIYRANSVAVEYFGFRIEIYSSEGNKLIAFGHALPSSLQGTFGRTSIPLLNSKGDPVCTIFIGYLFVRSLPSNVEPFKMNASYAKHWKKRTTLEVGHRGMGNSYTKCAVARENTLHSLNQAAVKGADYVEFDVHLTKDKVPIIFHDFHVLVSVAKRSPSIDDLATNNNNVKPGGVEEHELAVKDLKFNQLRLLHLDHVEHDRRSVLNNEGHLHYKVTGSHDEAEEHRPFPTLEGAFHFVEEAAGFNIEIKYPMEWSNGTERVFWILREERNAGTRRVVFSSFDPDVCTILTLKQNKYPVLFLSQGKTEKYMDFVDKRTQTSSMAVKFAAGTGLTGINLHSEDLLRDSEPIVMAKHFNLITFVWGDELVDKEVAQRFKNELRCDGIIFDSPAKMFSLVERQKKQDLFGGSTKKPPSPLQSPRHKQSFASNDEVNKAVMAERLPITTAAIEHLDLPVTNSITVNSKMQAPLLFSSAHSSTSSGISTDSNTTTVPTMRRSALLFQPRIS
ncbi:hypothetical protein M3Y97_00516800 [Aphelenchoides bicaudatus]|nr:hypothetical protein M3Y97_00516800 [Aphelenchoides bicaudatus]